MTKNILPKTDANLSTRWKIAQASEKELWAKMSDKELLEHSKKYYSKKAGILLKEIKKYFMLTQKIRFLQIGCGPADIINEIKIGKRYSIDPLADFYKEKFKINYKETNLIKGVGESLPYSNNYFDVVIFANVLDHTDSPQEVLSEIKRVLKNKGIVYLEAHFYQEKFLILSKIYGFFKRIFTGKIFNPCHPHMFSLEQLKSLVSKNFIILSEKIGEDIEHEINSLEELKELRKKEKFTRKIPAFFSLLGTINYTAFLRKN